MPASNEKREVAGVRVRARFDAHSLCGRPGRLSRWLDEPRCVKDVRGHEHSTTRGERYACVLGVFVTMLTIALIIVHATTLVELDAEAELYRETLLGITWDWPVEDK